MADPRFKSVEISLRTSEEIRRLFGRIGTSQNPRGLVLSAYRAALRSLKGKTGSQVLMDDSLITLRLSVLEAIKQILSKGLDIGMNQAETELKLWAVKAFGRIDTVDEAANAIVNIVDSQIQSAWAMSRMGAEEAVILGNAKRIGLLNPTVVTREAARYAALTVNSAYDNVIKESLKMAGDSEQFKKQAIAAIDDKTTDCCLRVHGQIVPLDGKFKLTGEPRFADEMDRPGFHWWCRSAMVLVPAWTPKDQLTLDMEKAASNELRAREETGKREKIHPSHARSGRK